VPLLLAVEASGVGASHPNLARPAIMAGMWRVCNLHAREDCDPSQSPCCSPGTLTATADELFQSMPVALQCSLPCRVLTCCCISENVGGLCVC
jgi:hypothetical protein